MASDKTVTPRQFLLILARTCDELMVVPTTHFGAGYNSGLLDLREHLRRKFKAKRRKSCPK